MSTKVLEGVCLHSCLLWMQKLHLEHPEMRAVTTQGSLPKQEACVSGRTKTLLTTLIFQNEHMLLGRQK